MKKIVFFAMFYLFTWNLSAQNNYTIKHSTGTLELSDFKDVQVEGYEGKEILIQVKTNKAEESDVRAKGLKAIGSLGMDNTGIGLIVKEEGNKIKLSPADPLRGINVEIKIPQNVKLSLTNQSLIQSGSADGAGIVFKNIQSEVNVSVKYESIKLENITGPLNVTSFYGDVEVSLNKSIKGPLSIVSFYGPIDISMSADLKASMDVQNSYGGLFASDELNIKMFSNEDYTIKTDKVANKKIDSNEPLEVIESISNITSDNNIFKKHMIATLNGGGEKIQLKSNYGAIYIRKK